MQMEMRALVLAAMAAVLQAAAAAVTTYTVGAPNGLWDLQTNYAEWVATKTFHPGDNITFTYSPELHDVVEVSKAGYDACSSINNVSAFRTGNDVVPLTAVGTRYFLCGLTGHCDSGMKIRVDVVAAAGSSPGPAAAAPTSAAASSATGIVGLGVLLVAVQDAIVSRALQFSIV
ncbi:mavicyanin-like [Phragmites australis]|uniref:mavicyanin-like n=1 Tax=Phragmites australis TaxID=29695 RepID=UPI002D792D2D|nr:mavicyanin-like [Phragmites australis]